MLVNGLNVTYDKSKVDYTVYHVETDGHSIVYAEGALSESYLDTGNRSNFSQIGNLVTFGTRGVCSWEKDAAACLEVSQSKVEPIYNRIANRAGVDTVSPTLVMDCDVCLVTDNGAVYQPIRQNDNQYVFHLCEKFDWLNLVSNSSRPCDVIGPFLDDRRELGISVGNIHLYQGDQVVVFDEHLREENLAGWHAAESDKHRWTTGSAMLDLKSSHSSDISVIAIEIKAGGPYLERNYITNIPDASVVGDEVKAS